MKSQAKLLLNDNYDVDEEALNTLNAIINKYNELEEKLKALLIKAGE